MGLKITTIGDGAMATVCSQILAGRRDTQTTMWVRDPAHHHEMIAAGENTRYLPGVSLEKTLRLEADDHKALEGAELILCAVPTQFIRPSLTRLKAHVPAGIPVVSVAK